MEKQKYEDMIAKLETTIQRMEDGTMDLDSLSNELTVAQKLIAQCRKKLTQVDNTIKEIYETDRLE